MERRFYSMFNVFIEVCEDQTCSLCVHPLVQSIMLRQLEEELRHNGSFIIDKSLYQYLAVTNGDLTNLNSEAHLCLEFYNQFCVKHLFVRLILINAYSFSVKHLLICDLRIWKRLLHLYYPRWLNSAEAAQMELNSEARKLVFATVKEKVQKRETALKMALKKARKLPGKPEKRKTKRDMREEQCLTVEEELSQYSASTAETTEAGMKIEVMATDSHLTLAVHTFPKRPSRERRMPNYFVAIQITNPEIKEKLEEVQHQLCESKRLPEASLISVKQMHLTLLVVVLDEYHCLHHVSQAFSDVQTDFSNLGFDKIDIVFEGIGLFRSDVVFMKIKKDEGLRRLTALADLVQRTFERYSVTIHDKHPFNPHVTVAKMSRIIRSSSRPVKRGNAGKIQKNSNDGFEDMLFGVESVKTLQLCSMNEKTDDGYYFYPLELSLLPAQ